MDFVKARRQYGFFIAQYKAGKINAQQLEDEVSRLEVIDQYQNRWQLGVRCQLWCQFSTASSPLAACRW